MSELPIELQSLHLRPIRSCPAIDVGEALVVETGLELDCAWMLVDGTGAAVDGVELPRLRQLRLALKTHELVLRAPGMLALHLALDAVDVPVTTTLGGARLAAYDMGALSAQWFTDLVGRSVRLVRFDPEQQRRVDARFAALPGAESAFHDSYPLRVVYSAARAAGVHSRADGGRSDTTTALSGAPGGQAAAGDGGGAAVAEADPAAAANLVIGGLQADDEADIEALVFPTTDGPIRLHLVEPGTGGPAAVHAVIAEGIDRVLRTGMPGRAIRRRT